MKIYLGIFFLLLCAVNGVSDKVKYKRQDVNIYVSLLKISNDALTMWLKMGIAAHKVQQSIHVFIQSAPVLEVQHFALFALCFAIVGYLIQRRQIKKLKADVSYYEEQMDRYHSDIKKSDAYYRGRIAEEEKNASEQYLSTKRAEIFHTKTQEKLQELESYAKERFGVKPVRPCPKYCRRLLPPYHLPPLNKKSRAPALYIIREEPFATYQVPPPVYRPAEPAFTRSHV